MPNWARGKVLRAAVRALSGDVTQIAMAGRVARKVHEAFPSDLLARQLAVYLDLWAGVDVEEDIREFEKFRARHTVRAIEDL